MKLYLVRHGETDWNKEKRLQGQCDIELNEYGIKLAELTAKGLADVHFDYIFSSPLKRAYKTAEILRGDRELEIVTDDRMKEICFGVNEGVPSDTIADTLDLFFHHPEKYVAPEGAESYEQLCARSRAFCESVLIPLSEKQPDANVLLTAHGAWNKSLIIYLKHLEIKNMWDGKFQKNCCVNIFDIHGYDFKLIEEAKVYYEES